MGLTVNGIDVNVPVSWTVPLESLTLSGPSAGFNVPVTTLPATVNVLWPLSLVIWVALGKTMLSAIEPISRTGSVTGAPNWSV